MSKRENGFVATALKAPKSTKERITTDTFSMPRMRHTEHVVLGSRSNSEATAWAILYCGRCGMPASDHPVLPSIQYSERYMTICNREADSFPYDTNDLDEASDYLLWPTGDITLPDKHYFDQTADKFADPDEYVSVDYELDALERYYDQRPEEFTAAFDADGTFHQGNLGSLEPESRNAYVEAIDGFTISKHLDDLLTRKYQNYLINAYVSKQNNKPRVGSVELTIDKAAATVTAACVKCHKAFSISMENHDEDYMERSVWAIISHGNNHSAKWFTEREEFYELSPTISDKSSNPQALTTDLSVQEQIEFLFDHQAHCKDSKCKCEDWLKHLTPALAL